MKTPWQLPVQIWNQGEKFGSGQTIRIPRIGHIDRKNWLLPGSAVGINLDLVLKRLLVLLEALANKQII